MLVSVAVTAQLARMIHAMQRTHDRRVDVLLDRLAHAKGQPWGPAPVDEELNILGQERSLALVEPGEDVAD